MTNPIPKKISELPTLGAISDGDLIPVVDISDTTFSSTGETKKVSYSIFKALIQEEINTDFVEEDPVFAASVAAGIDANDVGQWNAAYGWGNHAVQGYLQSISAQSIDVLNDVDTSTAAENDILRWNGNSWVASTETDSGTTINVLNDVGNVDIDTVIDGQVLKYNSTSQKWVNSTDAGGIQLSDLSVQQNNASGSGSLSYAAGNGKFTFTPPNLSSFITGVSSDSAPALGGNLDLSSKTINGTGTIQIDGDIRGKGFRLTENNATITGTTGQNRDIKVIGGAPYFYDGSAWRQFYLIGGTPTTQPADPDWQEVMIRSTFDVDFRDNRYGNNGVPGNADNVEISSASPFSDSSGKSLRVENSYLGYDVSDSGIGGRYNFNGEFTLEAWILVDDVISTASYANSIFSGHDPSAPGDYWALTISNISNTVDPDRTFGWYNGNNSDHNGNGYAGTQLARLTAAEAVGTWIHVALVWESATSDVVLYLNGQEKGRTQDGDIKNPATFNLGKGDPGDVASRDFDGFYDDVRITGDVRYTANFTPPTGNLPETGTATTLLPPPFNKKGEITLSATAGQFSWKGSYGVTLTKPTLAGSTYRLSFTTPYATDKDYYVIAQGMDHSGGASSYITVSRSADYVDITVKNQANDNAVNSGYLGVQIINNL